MVFNYVYENKEIESKLNEVKEYIKVIEYLQQASGIVYWDMRIGMPKKALAGRSEVAAYLSGEMYKLTTGEKVKEFIEYFADKQELLSVVDKAMIRKLKKEYEQVKVIPEDRYKEYVILSSKSENAWEQAKAANDYELFKPYLKQMIEFQKEFIGYKGHKACKYDTLLDDYEQGITVEKLDEVFGEVRDAIVTLLNKIKASNVKADDSFLKGKFDKAAQEGLGLFMLEKLGFDFDAGRIDESVHPFTINFGNKDVRLTTNYGVADFRSALYSTIHEGGHGIYEQNISDDLANTALASGASMGIHESQSRYYENILGRGEDFWRFLYPEVVSRFPQFKDISFEDFYKGINAVVPSLIRIEADELTYSLHIIIRYEIEKELINGDVDIDEVPELWNKKYTEYLGITPKTYSEGILQDTHWSCGLIGYFPSYALGNLYGAQMVNKMKQDMPNLSEDVQKGEFLGIHSWLKENVHQYGSVYSPADLIKNITGEELTAKYFIEYLNEKYSKLYNL